MAKKANNRPQTGDKTRPTTVAVYGTLRKNFGNHGLLAKANFVERITIPKSRIGVEDTVTRATSYQEGLSMYNLGAFPAVVPGVFDDASGEVVVEIYDVNEQELASMDMLEGHPNFYRRFRIPLPNKSKRNKAFIYMQLHSQLAFTDALIPSGDWEDAA